ncbi:MAG: rRNA maturation RNase YbeY [Acidobacteriota bacterium]
MNSEPPNPSAPPPDRTIEPRCEITLQNPCRYQESGARHVRPWIESLVEEQAPAAASFAVRFISDREMRRLNATYRGRDKTTDVLSFPGEVEEDAGLSRSEVGRIERHLGDVAISVPTARRQAGQRGHSVETELRILMLHGMLHCLGYDHETDDGAMDSLERQLRSRYIAHD